MIKFVEVIKNYVIKKDKKAKQQQNLIILQKNCIKIPDNSNAIFQIIENEENF